MKMVCCFRLLIALMLPLGIMGQASEGTNAVYRSGSLHIDRLAPGVYLHVSFLQVTGYGKVDCNGLVYVSGGEALVADSPSDSVVAAELLDWIAEELEARVTFVVVNHFHDDCVGGLPAFHARGIPSFGHNKTLELAAGIGNPQPKHGFERELRLRIGTEIVTTRYFGAGHTIDNTVTYVESESVLFGGCFVKSLGAGRGNLEDADLDAWPESIRQVRSAYPRAKIVIPGHGAVGGPDLLDFTEALFRG